MRLGAEGRYREVSVEPLDSSAWWGLGVAILRPSDSCHVNLEKLTELCS